MKSRANTVLQSTSSCFPGWDQVFLLGEPGSSRAFRARLEIGALDVYALMRGVFSLAGPVRAHWSSGAQIPKDVIWTELASPMIISQRLVDTLRDAGMVGWGTYPLSLQGKDGSEIPGYHGLYIHGRCGGIDNSRSVQVSKQLPGGVFPAWRGLYFDPSSWDGSDLFMPEGKLGWVFATDRLRRLLQRERYSNLVFTQLSSVERSKVAVESSARARRENEE